MAHQDTPHEGEDEGETSALGEIGAKEEPTPHPGGDPVAIPAQDKWLEGCEIPGREDSAI